MIRKAVVLGGIAGIVTILTAFVFSEAMVKKEPYVERLLESEHFRNGRTVAMVCELTAYCPGACCNTEHVTGDKGELAIDWSDQLAVGGPVLRRAAQGQLLMRQAAVCGVNVAAAAGCVVVQLVHQPLHGCPLVWRQPLAAGMPLSF